MSIYADVHMYLFTYIYIYVSVSEGLRIQSRDETEETAVVGGFLPKVGVVGDFGAQIRQSEK